MSPLGAGNADGKNFMGADPLTLIAGASSGIASLLKAPQKQMLTPNQLQDPQMPQPGAQMNLPNPQLQSVSGMGGGMGGGPSLEQLLKQLGGK